MAWRSNPCQRVLAMLGGVSRVRTPSAAGPAFKLEPLVERVYGQVREALAIPIRQFVHAWKELRLEQTLQRNRYSGYEYLCGSGARFQSILLSGLDLALRAKVSSCNLRKPICIGFNRLVLHLLFVERGPNSPKKYSVLLHEEL